MQLVFFSFPLAVPPCIDTLITITSNQYHATLLLDIKPSILRTNINSICARAVNSLTHKGSGGNEKLPPRRIPTVGIVRKVPSTQTQLSHKHHHHGGAVSPSYGVLTMYTPDRTRATSSEGVGQERFGLD